MGAYETQLAAGGTGNTGFGVQLRPAVSDVFGHSGIGVRLATNFLLLLQDEQGSPVDAGLPYTLSYYNPATQQQVALPLFHNPAIPYQTTLPYNQPIIFSLGAINTGRYRPSQSAEVTIAANSFATLQVKLSYPAGSVYAILTRKRFF